MASIIASQGNDFSVERRVKPILETVLRLVAAAHVIGGDAVSSTAIGAPITAAWRSPRKIAEKGEHVIQ